MATVYSLVCWGGRLGKTVTLTIASPCVVTSTSHGLRDGARLVFSTTGALPTGITAGTTYYAKSTAANTFNLYSDAALTNIVNTSGSQSGTHTAKSRLMLDYFAQCAGRWGDTDAERCYDSLYNWYTVRSANTSISNDEVCELGEGFVDSLSNAVTIAVEAGVWRITSTVNGIRTEAHHQGRIDGTGYTAARNVANSVTISLTTVRCELDGFRVVIGGNGANQTPINITGALAKVSNMIVIGYFVRTGQGIYVNAPAVDVINCLVIGCYHGIYVYNTAKAVRVLNCATISNANGFTTNNTSGFVCTILNCISYGNTVVNWPAWAVTASNNAGESDGAGGYLLGTPIGSNPVALLSTDFTNYAGTGTAPAWTIPPDYSPVSGSPVIDAGLAYYGTPVEDVAGNEVPSYNNGGAEAVDIGCYEYDHGYGNHPASTNVTFLGVVAGSEIHVYDSEDNELVGTESCAANQSLTWGIPTNPNVKITIIKRGLRWMKFTYLSEEGPQMIPIFPQPDLGYNNPA